MQSHNYAEEKKEEAWKWNSYSCSTGRMHKRVLNIYSCFLLTIDNWALSFWPDTRPNHGCLLFAQTFILATIHTSSQGWIFTFFWARKDQQYKSGAGGSGDLPYSGGNGVAPLLSTPKKVWKVGKAIHEEMCEGKLFPLNSFVGWIFTRPDALWNGLGWSNLHCPFVGVKVTFYGSTISLHGKPMYF